MPTDPSCPFLVTLCPSPHPNRGGPHSEAGVPAEAADQLWLATEELSALGLLSGWAGENRVGQVTGPCPGASWGSVTRTCDEIAKREIQGWEPLPPLPPLLHVNHPNPRSPSLIGRTPSPFKCSERGLWYKAKGSTVSHCWVSSQDQLLQMPLHWPGDPSFHVPCHSSRKYLLSVCYVPSLAGDRVLASAD